MPNTNKKNDSLGFTLIELLVVILVIGTLSGILLGVVNSEGVRSKARDSQRKADLNKIRLALETYYADNRAYPISNGTGAGTWEQVKSGSTLVTTLQPTYINLLPLDPSKDSCADTNPCNLSNNCNRYHYLTDVNGNTYRLVAIMEVSSSNDDSPCTGVVCAGGDADNFCYMVKNP